MLLVSLLRSHCVLISGGIHKRKKVSLFRPHTPLPSGEFSVSLDGLASELIPIDASSSLMEAILEASWSLEDQSAVNVSHRSIQYTVG